MPKSTENPDDRPYTVYRSRPRIGLRLSNLFRRTPLDLRKRPRTPEDRARRVKPSWWRILRVVLLTAGGWLFLSFILFMISAHYSTTRLPNSAKRALTGGDHILFGSSTILVLGSDKRPPGSKEPGAVGPGRADTIMLMRFKGGESSKLSIPRDTQVTIPGHGVDKINASFAYGGAALATRTIEYNFPPIKINHVIEVNFEGFPKFVDSLGGVTMRTSCIDSTFSGKRIRLKAGEHHLSGEEALQVVRVRQNACNIQDNDLTRAARQQEFLNAVKSQLKSPWTFLRLPWVAWEGPGTLDTDLGGFGQLALFLEIERASSASTRVLPVAPIPGSSNLQALKPQTESAVAAFMDASG